MNILFICTGNTCRSPMAEAILKEKSPNLNVQSAGIYANEKNDANPLTLQVLQQHDISLNHRSQIVTQELLEWADHVLTMTKSHKQVLVTQYPKYKNKIHLLKQFIIEPKQGRQSILQKMYTDIEQKKRKFEKNNEHLTSQAYEEKLNEYLADDLTELYHLKNNLQNLDVSDPFGGNLDIYEATYDELNQLIALLINRIK